MPESGVRESEFTGIVEQYREPIRRYVRSLVRDDGEAEDIAQEAFLRAYQGLSGLKDPDKVSPWLYRIATNLCYDRFRQSSSRPPATSLDGETDATADTPGLQIVDQESPRLDKVIEQGEMSSCVREYLDQLPDDYRAAILLHDVQGLTNPEVAEMLGCSLATAKIRLHRARKKLKEALDRACDFSCDDRGVTVCEPKPDSG